MNTHAFLSQVLPSSGLLIAAHLKKIETDYIWVNDVEPDIAGILKKSTEFVWDQQDAYFALASYNHNKVWNPTAKNYNGSVGKFETRTQANTRSMRTLFLDIDVKQDGDHYRSQADAARGLISFGNAIHFPIPMVVNSGWGLHAYWTFLTEIASAAWRPIAERFKAAATHFNLLTDRPLIANQACVLRVPGTFNFKHGQIRPVEIVQVAPDYDSGMLTSLLDTYLSEHGVTPTATPKRSRVVLSNAAPASPIGNNIGVTNDPVNPAILEYECGFFGEQVATHGATAKEPKWHLAIGLAKFCEPQQATVLAVSDRHPGFDAAATQDKAAKWTAGPPKCTTIHALDGHTKTMCESCVHWGKITSPVEVGRILPQAPPATVTVGPVTVIIPNPPLPYKRTTIPKKAVIIESETAEGKPVHEVVAPYDLYPISILRQLGIEDNIDESSMWRMHLPRVGVVDVSIAQSMITDPRRLYAFLMSKGYYISPSQATKVQQYMSAYLQHLADTTDRNKIYERLGWHNDYHSYVTPNEVYHRDGTISPHTPGVNINRVTKRAIRKMGTFEEWKKALDFYKGPRNVHFRAYIYAAFASPIMHMTGFIGTLIAASGDTGHGKTTVLELCASIFGEPEAMKVSGGKDGSTMNALYNIIGTWHSIPMLWDETTEREPDEMRKFILHLPGGKGKERLLEHQREITWEGLVLSTANTDDLSRLVASGKDSNPHLMRMVSIDFEAPNQSTSAKIAADAFRRQIHENYGHAGPLFLQQLAINYPAIKKLVEQTMVKIDTMVQAKSSERYWTATIAAMYVAAKIAKALGLHDFDVEEDLKWMINHLHRMRDNVFNVQNSSENLLSEMLDKYFSNTLVVTTTMGSGNIDNAVRVPHGPLLIRHEADNGTAYIARNAVMAYCSEVKASFRRIEGDLFRSGIIIDRSVQKVLGAGTAYSRVQVRCWKLKLPGGAENPLQIHAQQLLAAAGAKVVNITKGIKK